MKDVNYSVAFHNFTRYSVFDSITKCSVTDSEVEL